MSADQIDCENISMRWGYIWKWRWHASPLPWSAKSMLALITAHSMACRNIKRWTNVYVYNAELNIYWFVLFVFHLDLHSSIIIKNANKTTASSTTTKYFLMSDNCQGTFINQTVNWVRNTVVIARKLNNYNWWCMTSYVSQKNGH